MKKNVISLFASAIVLAILFTGCSKEDTTAPVITLVGPSSINHVLNAAYTDQGATADDDEDGDLTSTITSNVSVVNEDLTGNYTITYEVTDAAGNVATATRTVRVYNEAENLVGTYSVVDESPYPSSPGSPYNETLTVSSTINKRIWVQKFGNYTDGVVYMDVNLTSNTITIPVQTVLCGAPGFQTNRTFQNAPSTTSTIGTGMLTIDYKESVGASDVIARGVYTKQ